MDKKTELGKKILESQRAYVYVDDSIVIELVKNAIRLCEEKNMSWIIQGFPKT